MLNDTFGAPVTIIPQSGPSRSVKGVFRAEPIEVDGGEGRDLLTLQLSIALLQADAEGVEVGDAVRPFDGSLYRIVNRHPSGSPASDALTYFELERINNGA